MRLPVLVITSLALASSAAFVDAIADRKALMKERGGLVGQLSKVTKGEEPFDAAKVLAALTALQANGEKFDVALLFPAGSNQGDTKALPKIWEDAAGFEAAEDKFEAPSTPVLLGGLGGLTALLGVGFIWFTRRLP